MSDLFPCSPQHSHWMKPDLAIAKITSRNKAKEITQHTFLMDVQSPSFNVLVSNSPTEKCRGASPKNTPMPISHAPLSSPLHLSISNSICKTLFTSQLSPSTDFSAKTHLSFNDQNQIISNTINQFIIPSIFQKQSIFQPKYQNNVPNEINNLKRNNEINVQKQNNNIKNNFQNSKLQYNHNTINYHNNNQSTNVYKNNIFQDQKNDNKQNNQNGNNQIQQNNINQCNYVNQLNNYNQFQSPFNNQKSCNNINQQNNFGLNNNQNQYDIPSQYDNSNQSQNYLGFNKYACPNFLTSTSFNNSQEYIQSRFHHICNLFALNNERIQYILKSIQPNIAKYY